eukprot:1754001-Pleurochrysis_carterae.AAC.1
MLLEAHKPKAMGDMASLHLLRDRQLVYMGSKLYKPAGEPRDRAVLTLIPPGLVTHGRREDDSECVEISSNIAIVNEVRYVCRACELLVDLFVVCYLPIKHVVPLLYLEADAVRSNDVFGKHTAHHLACCAAPFFRCAQVWAPGADVGPRQEGEAHCV